MSSYLGRGIDQIDNISTLDNLSFNGSLQTFNLTQNSVAFVPVSADALQIQIDGVIQANNFTISGSSLTFDFVPSGSSVCNSVKHFGVGLLTTVSDSSITTAKLGADSVNGSKIADDSISDEHLDITAITGQTEKTSLADADKFLISDSASSGALKYVEKQYLPSGNWVLLQTTTLTSTTGNVDFNNVFDSTYKNYVVFGSEIKGDADGKILCRFGTGSTPTFDNSSNYSRVASYITSAGGDTIKHSTTDTAVLVTPNATDISDGDMSFRMVFPEPQNTSRRLQVYFEGTQYDGALTYFAGTGRCDNIAFATPVTSVRFTPNTGSGFASGSFKLYGVK